MKMKYWGFQDGRIATGQFDPGSAKLIEQKVEKVHSQGKAVGETAVEVLQKQWKWPRLAATSKETTKA